MKRPVEWHKDCLRNMRRTHAEEQERIDRIAHDLLARIARADALEAQIARAEKEGLEAFDSEKFNMRGEP